MILLNFAIVFDLQRSNYDNQNELSGYNASSNSGIIQVGLNFGNNIANLTTSNATITTFPATAGTNCGTLDDMTCWVALQHTRLLQIGKDDSQVIY